MSTRRKAFILSIWARCGRVHPLDAECSVVPDLLHREGDERHKDEPARAQSSSEHKIDQLFCSTAIVGPEHHQVRDKDQSG
eukprot:COSAG02_NODE_3024_length_7521_cov_4.903126_1_plen_81_part_00